MEVLGAILVFGFIWYIIFKPADQQSTSYRLGKGLGRKTQKLGKWIMDE
jgi:hypothetical protein